MSIGEYLYYGFIVIGIFALLAWSLNVDIRALIYDAIQGLTSSAKGIQQDLTSTPTTMPSEVRRELDYCPRFDDCFILGTPSEGIKLYGNTAILFIEGCRGELRKGWVFGGKKGISLYKGEEYDFCQIGKKATPSEPNYYSCTTYPCHIGYMAGENKNHSYCDFEIDHGRILDAQGEVLAEGIKTQIHAVYNKDSGKIISYNCSGKVV